MKGDAIELGDMTELEDILDLLQLTIYSIGETVDLRV
jgi:hypothetical protein